MSTSVFGLRDASDPKHIKMVTAIQACLDADIPLPKELEDYCDGGTDPDSGLRVKVKSKKVEKEGADCIDVVVADIPQNVKVIRFCNSW